ncbi:MAG: MBL fold metallo-hydrolase [Desulfobacteraceae bacterium]|nr:MBL fold metallo-hydrolase [Desulfobacteraceae bacterium]
MNIVKKHNFKGLEAVELGYSPIGRPFVTVLFYIADGVMIDTGQTNMRKYVAEFIKQKDLKYVLLTHHHEDHTGNAAMIRKMHDTDVLGHPLMIRKMQTGYNIMPYQHLLFGKAKKVSVLPYPPVIESDNICFRPVHTPGHSKDHTVYLVEEKGWLFSGDLYVGEKIKYFRADENIADQIRSLKKILKYDFKSLYCAHRPCPENGKIHIQRKLNYLEEFCGNVRMLSEKGYSETAIAKKLGNRSDRNVRLFTMGNVSFGHMVRSAVKNQ